jgi:2',3'-cyclic-nucleotide 2'-phosphodiesterase (5'-nucleotidase family)
MSDIVIGLTHLSIDQDLAIAKKHPDVKLIMGGHEHDNMLHKVGDATVAKADANAKTVYLHVLRYDKRSGKISVRSELVTIDETMPRDPEIAALIGKWNEIMEENVKQIIPEPYEVVYHADPPLDGKETTIRHQQANMGQLFTQAMLAYAQHDPAAAIMNSGSIRIDDEISGEIVAIDVIRALPFHGSLWEVTMKGKLLSEVLDFSENAKGSGAYLQYNGIDRKGGTWHIQGKPVEAGKEYMIAINDFLLKGYDIPFLKEGVEGITHIYKPDESDNGDLRNDVRKMIINYLKTL